VPDRLSPGCAGVCAAPAAAPPAAATPAAAATGPYLDRARGGQSVVGGSGPHLHGDRHGAELDWLRGDLPVERADRDAGAAGRALDAVDGAADRGERAGHGDGDVSDRSEDGDR